MLTRLYIRDFALIREVAIEFGAGFNVITGETGAGKSILMGALYSILGGHASADLVRAGAERCVVEGIFEFDDGAPSLDHLRALDVEMEDDQLILRREVRANGRSRAFVNGLAAPLKRLREIGDLLVDLHGQHEHQSLLDTRRHAEFLDAFGGLGAALTAVAARHREMGQARIELAELEQERARLVEQEELRQFQLGEIRDLAPEVAEDERLEVELRRLENAETLMQTCAGLFDQLYQADGSITEQLSRGHREVERLATLDPDLAALEAALEELTYGVEDVAERLRDYMRGLEIQPERTEEVRERLESLRRLRKRYGGSLQAALDLATELEEQEQRTESMDAEIAAARERLDVATKDFASCCLTLSDGRARAATELSTAVAQELRALGMPQARFHVELQRQEDAEGPVEQDGRRWRADSGGAETAEFLISPNAGEALRPLTRIASGGEISRVMLALKDVIAARDTISTLVFDEIDVGISGRIAAAVARRLAALSASHQTIVITHLPQIASAAAGHYSVRKREKDGRTLTEVQRLHPEERVEEIAHLLAGETVSEAALRHAQEMLG